MVELLLANKADVNAKNNKGETPLRVVANKGKQGVADLLLQHGGHK
jgi:ankyrin repeat protein